MAGFSLLRRPFCAVFYSVLVASQRGAFVSAASTSTALFHVPRVAFLLGVASTISTYFNSQLRLLIVCVRDLL